MVEHLCVFKSSIAGEERTVSQHFPSRDKQREWRSGEKLKATLYIHDYSTCTHKNSGIKNKREEIGPYSFLVGNDVWYVLNSGNF